MEPCFTCFYLTFCMEYVLKELHNDQEYYWPTIYRRRAGAAPSSETQGQSVGSGERARRKFSSTGERYLGSDCHRTVSKNSSAGSWLGTKMLCIIVPNRRTVSPEFFSWFRTRRLLFRSRLVWLMHQRNARSQETSVWYKIPIWFQNTVYSKN